MPSLTFNDITLRFKLLNLSITFVLLSGYLMAQLSLHSIFSDHMVLQRDRPIKIWGQAIPNSPIDIQFENDHTVTKSNEQGQWFAYLDKKQAGGPYHLKITAGDEQLILSDILIGDVWLCSGQSNMEWPVSRADNFPAERRAAHHSNIRHYGVHHELSFTPLSEFATKSHWEVCTPATVGDFTAVGYYFAREITAQTGVPIGLLHSSWGGSQIESWISEMAMLKSDVLSYYPQQMTRNWEANAQKWESKLIQQCTKGDQRMMTATLTDYLSDEYDFSSWAKVNPNGGFDWQGYWAFRGSAYIHQKVKIEPDLVNKGSSFSFGTNHTPMAVYINGQLCYYANTNGRIVFDLPPSAWRAGDNDVLIHFSYRGDRAHHTEMGFIGGMNDFNIDFVSEKIGLLSQSWDFMPDWNAERYYMPWMNNEAAILYNAMIAPITDFPIAGALWYQGESNAKRAAQYEESFPLLINSWRDDWGYDFPFYFVQLSSFGKSSSSNEGSNWAELREAQTKTLQIPNTAMAVTIDIGNPNDIHPTNKQDVGRRLALPALSSVYGKNDITISGPSYKSVQFIDQAAILSFDHIADGLICEDKYGYLKGFEIAGSDGKFHFAQARIENNKVIVIHPAVAAPAAVRYGWANSPVECNLSNTAGLPAVPFRTDDWRRITDGSKF